MNSSLCIGIIGGAGWLGGSIARALVGSDFCREERLILSYRSSKPDFLNAATWVSDNQLLVDRSDAIVVSVRPNDFPALNVNAQSKLIISVMAGVPLYELTHRIGSDHAVRSLPNAAAEVRKSYTPWIASAAVTESERSFAAKFFSSFGVQDEVPSEDQLDYFAALTGTGPAYPALFIETMKQDAIAQGIERGTAERAVTTLLYGSAALMERQARAPAEVVDEFIAYNGMTSAALQAMRDASLSTVVRRGIEAALERAKSLQNSS